MHYCVSNILFIVLLLLLLLLSSSLSFSPNSAAATAMLRTRQKTCALASLFIAWQPSRPQIRNVHPIIMARRLTITSFLSKQRHSSSSSSSGPSSSSSSLRRFTAPHVAFFANLNDQPKQDQQQQQGSDNNHHHHHDGDLQQQQQQQPSSSSSLPPLLQHDPPPPQNDDSNNNTTATSAVLPVHVMQSSIETLKMANIDEAEDSVYHLLSFALNLSWETGFRDLRRLHVLLLHSSSSASNKNDIDIDNDDNGNSKLLRRRKLTHEELEVFQNLLHRRLNHEPIQYLVGKWDFLDHVFKIEPPLLCPRPETEELVLLAWQDLQEMLLLRQQQQEQPPPIRILDVGSGTGCIGISLLAAAAAKAATATTSASTSVVAAPPPCQVVALDVEERAIAVSTWNAQCILSNNNSNSCYQAILSSAADFEVDNNKNHDHHHHQRHGFDLVISNPPYIPQADMETLDDTVLNYESHQALFGGGADGMNVIRDIVRKLPQWCKPGVDAICWMEVNPTHPKLLQDWLASTPSLGVEHVQTKKDLQGKDRFVKLRVKSSQGKQDE